MGTVFLASRADDQYRKAVAIKLIRRGMDTESILSRFRHERQILASLDHPNIARLLEGGTTEDGLPYFVMEYIEGQAIDQYCDTQKLTTADRLKLFRTVCLALFMLIPAPGFAGLVSFEKQHLPCDRARASPACPKPCRG